MHALPNQIVSLNISDLLRIVTSYVSLHPFQKFLMNRVPPSSAKFLSYIDQFAKLYDQCAAMDYETRRSNIDDNTLYLLNAFLLSTLPNFLLISSHIIVELSKLMLIWTTISILYV